MAAPAEKLVPVHDDVQFKYNTSYVALGGGLALGGSGGGGKGGAAAAPPSVWEERPQTAEPAKLPPPLEDLDDFISLEDAAPAAQVGDPPRATDENRLAAALPRNARSCLCRSLTMVFKACTIARPHRCRRQHVPVQAGAAEPAAAAGEVQAAAAGGGVGNLLDDYVSLGILEDPAAAASKKAAAAARSQRPELLERVPWMAAFKGIRSPLLRLHQGGCEGRQSGQLTNGPGGCQLAPVDACSAPAVAQCNAPRI